MRDQSSYLVVGVLGALLGVLVARVSGEWILAGVTVVFAIGMLGLGGGDLTTEERRFRVLLAAWVAYYVSGLTFRGRGTEDIATTALDSAAAIRVVLVGLVAIVVMAGLFGRRSPRLDYGARKSLGFNLIGMYCALAVVSALWSIYPSWTLYKGVEYAVGIALVSVVVRAIGSYEELKSLTDTTWFLYGSVLVSVWIGVLLMPGSAISAGRGILPWQLRGVMPVIASNGVGDISATILIVALVRLGTGLGSRRLWITMLVLSVLSLVLAQSRSAILGLSVALAVLIAIVPRLRKRGFVLALLGGGLGYTFLDLVVGYLRRGQSDALIQTLSGRTEYWDAALTLASREPWLGAGAYAAGRFGVLEELGATTTSSLHNTWVEVFVGNGVFGILLLGTAAIVILVTLARSVLKRGHLASSHIAAEACGVLLLELVRSFFTSGALIWHPATRFLMVVVVYMVWNNIADQEEAALPGQPDAPWQERGMFGRGR